MKPRLHCFLILSFKANAHRICAKKVEGNYPNKDDTHHMHSKFKIKIKIIPQKMIHMHTLELQDKDDKIKIKIITLKKVHTNIHSEFTPDKNQPHRCLELLDKKYQIVRSYFSFFYSMFNMLCMGSWGPLGLLVFVL